MPEDPVEREWLFWRDAPKIIASGGLIDPGYLDGFHRLGCGYVRRCYQLSLEAHTNRDFADQFESLSLMFVDNPTANALALEREKRRGLVVYLGLIRRLWAAFYLSLGDPQFLEGAFDSAPGPLPSPVERQALYDPAFFADPATHWPDDRRVALHDMFDRAVSFLVSHELAHHARGHLSFLRQTMGVEAKMTVAKRFNFWNSTRITMDLISWRH